MKIIIISFLLALNALSEPTFDTKAGPGAAATAKQNDTAANVKKALSINDIGGATRLKIEGATFRSFNLFFPEITIDGKATAEDRKNLAQVRQIVERDLAITGNFSMVSASETPNDALIKQKGAEGLSRIKLSFSNDKIAAVVEHKNLINGKTSKKYIATLKKESRRLSHLLAQSIFEEFIGAEDLFLLQIAAVKRTKTDSQIVLFDFDGQNEQKITKGIWGKATPFFAPSGKSILYTIISKEGQGIVEQEIGSVGVQFRTKKPGLNLDPRVLPNNLGMLATLSLGKNANIYRTSREGNVIGTLTESSGFNLSPTISPDAKTFAFVSSRSGTPQIYEQTLDFNAKKTEAKRLTFQGRYNQTPQYSPDGSFIAFTGRDEEKIFDVFLLERSSGRISRVTQKQGRNQEPFFTPSGRFVIFTSERDGRAEPDVYIASLSGNHQYRLTTDGGYLSPVVRPKQ
jgi:TolB protein